LVCGLCRRNHTFVLFVAVEQPLADTDVHFLSGRLRSVLEHGKPVADASTDVDPAAADQAVPCSAVIHFGQIVRGKICEISVAQRTRCEEAC
jgi:hypothetical protein